LAAGAVAEFGAPVLYSCENIFVKHVYAYVVIMGNLSGEKSIAGKDFNFIHFLLFILSFCFTRSPLCFNFIGNQQAQRPLFVGATLTVTRKAGSRSRSRSVHSVEQLKGFAAWCGAQV